MNMRWRQHFVRVVTSGVVLFLAAEVSAMPSAALEKIRNGDSSAIRIALSDLDSRGRKPDRALLDALHEGLIARPVEVLRAIGDGKHLRLICGPAPHLTYDLAENSLSERLSAVGTALFEITDPEDKKRLHSCADELDRAENRLRRATRAR